MSLDLLPEAGFQGFPPPGFVRTAREAALAGGVPGIYLGGSWVAGRGVLPLRAGLLHDLGFAHRGVGNLEEAVRVAATPWDGEAEQRAGAPPPLG